MTRKLAALQKDLRVIIVANRVPTRESPLESALGGRRRRASNSKQGRQDIRQMPERRCFAACKPTLPGALRTD